MTDNVIYGVDFQANKNKPKDDFPTATVIDGYLVFKTQDTAPSEYQAPVKDGA